MQVDEATVRRIARLARIKITDAEAKSLEGELSGMLDWVISSTRSIPRAWNR